MTVSSGGVVRGAGRLEGEIQVYGAISGVTAYGGALELSASATANDVTIDGGYFYDRAIATGTVVLDYGHSARFAQAAAFAPTDSPRAARVFNSGPNCLTPFAYSIGTGGAVHL